jgi:hypothetical protein
MMLRVGFGKRAAWAPQEKNQSTEEKLRYGLACVHMFTPGPYFNLKFSGSLAITFMHYVPASGTSSHMPVETHISIHLSDPCGKCRVGTRKPADTPPNLLFQLVGRLGEYSESRIF